MEDKKPIISFKGADIVNGEATVIYGMDMDIHPGDFVYIVGKVGTGKTSIIRTIIAENPLGKGSATVCGYNLNELKEKYEEEIALIIEKSKDHIAEAQREAEKYHQVIESVVRKEFETKFEQTKEQFEIARAKLEKDARSEKTSISAVRVQTLTSLLLSLIK